MKKYLVVVHGENCCLWEPTSSRRHWFYVSRYVEAVDASAAGATAIEQVSADPYLRLGLRNPPEDPPRLTVEEVLDVEGFARLPELEPGFTFCADEERGPGIREGDL